MNIAYSLNFVTCPDATGGHRMAWHQWGDAHSAHVVVCAHGLSRQGRDFDVLAQSLCQQAIDKGQTIRVVCPDVVGRGESDWLQDPMAYQVPFYVADMLAMLAQIHLKAPVRELDWVGTSMGGLIGLVIAGQAGLPLPVPVRRLVFNDVGPNIEWQAIVRIGTYLGKAGAFKSLQEAADAMLAVSTGFGPHTPAQWLELSRHMVKPLETSTKGELRLHYDPAIALPFKQATEASTLEGQAMLWALYDAIAAPTLLLRGQDSDLLSPATALAMTQRGPKATLVEFAGVGHAPTLIASNQLAAVSQFLL